MCCEETSWVTFLGGNPCLYSTYSSFLVINVCNQRKTLCSPCIYCHNRYTDMSLRDNHVFLCIIFYGLCREYWHRGKMYGIRAKLEIWGFLSSGIRIRDTGYSLSVAARYVSGLVFKRGNVQYSWKFPPLKTRPLCCYETSGKEYPLTRRQILATQLRKPKNELKIIKNSVGNSQTQKSFVNQNEVKGC